MPKLGEQIAEPYLKRLIRSTWANVQQSFFSAMQITFQKHRAIIRPRIQQHNTLSRRMKAERIHVHMMLKTAVHHGDLLSLKHTGLMLRYHRLL